MEIQTIRWPDADRRSAFLAASQGAEAIGALLLFAQEGAAAGRPFGDLNVVALLAAALARAASIEFDNIVGFENIGGLVSCGEERRALKRLQGACVRYTDEWA